MDFEKIYRVYFQDVYLFLLALCRDQCLAEELAQETFYKALKNIGRYKEKSSIKAWLCQIGKNAYFDYLKKQKHIASDEVPEDMRSPSDAAGTEDYVISKDEALSIYKVIHLLGEPHKEVFTLRVLGDLSFKEIGEIFGRGEGWARVTYHRAKLKVVEKMKEG